MAPIDHSAYCTSAHCMSFLFSLLELRLRAEMLEYLEAIFLESTTVGSGIASPRQASSEA
jgi:hypothetical protein